jgi:hypothetical protein
MNADAFPRITGSKANRRFVSCGTSAHALKLMHLVVMLLGSLALAEPSAETKIEGWRQLSENWRNIEPHLFTAAGFKRHLGESVRFEGKLVSRGSPLIVRLASGTVARVTHVNKADREFLAEFRKPPSIATVEGILRAVDPATHTVTIQAVDTRFEQ